MLGIISTLHKCSKHVKSDTLFESKLLYSNRSVSLSENLNFNTLGEHFVFFKNIFQFITVVNYTVFMTSDLMRL